MTRVVAARARPLTGVAPAALALSLALAVIGPLLAGGYVLLLDFPSGPELHRFELFPVPSSVGIANSVPFTALLAALADVHPYLPEKALLLAPLVLGVVGAQRLARVLGAGATASVYGGAVFVMNPFVYDRFLAGQLALLLAYALLPWATCSLVARWTSAGRHGVVVGVWVAALAALNLHMAGVYVLLVVVSVVLGPKRLALAGVIGAVGASASAYWVLPFLLSPPQAPADVGELDVFASQPSGYGIYARLLALDGFWRDEFTSGGERHPLLYLLVLPIASLALFGAARLLATDRRRDAILLGVCAIGGLLFAGGTAFPPTEPIVETMVGQIPGLALYREPQKLLALTVLAYAALGAVGLDAVVRRFDPRTAAAVTVAGIAAAVAYAYPMLWGFGGQVASTHYPADWKAAARAMEIRGKGTAIVLPWRLYGVWSVSDGRIIANPAPSFFPGEVVVSDDAGLPGAVDRSRDPFVAYVDRVLHLSRVAVGERLGAIGVRYVVVLQEPDVARYAFLNDQQDLRTVFSTSRVRVLENLAWRGRLYPAAEIRDAEPAVARAGTNFLPLARALPGWPRVPSMGSRYLVTARRCTDGWRLADESARCHLAAAAAFPSPDSPATLWRPLAGANLIGYALSALAAIAAVGFSRRRS